jgi:hypothetical protein
MRLVNNRQVEVGRRLPHNERRQHHRRVETGGLAKDLLHRFAERLLRDDQADAQVVEEHPVLVGEDSEKRESPSSSRASRPVDERMSASSLSR